MYRLQNSILNFPRIYSNTVCHMFIWLHKCKTIQLYNQNVTNVLILCFISKGKIELHESPSVYGSYSSNFNTSCNNHNGEECDQRNASTCQRGLQVYLIPPVQLFFGIFCELDQFLGHKIYQCLDSPGMFRWCNCSQCQVFIENISQIEIY